MTEVGSVMGVPLGVVLLVKELSLGTGLHPRDEGAGLGGGSNAVGGGEASIWIPTWGLVS